MLEECGKEAEVPATGLSVPSKELYAHQTISYLIERSTKNLSTSDAAGGKVEEAVNRVAISILRQATSKTILAAMKSDEIQEDALH